MHLISGYVINDGLAVMIGGYFDVLAFPHTM